MDSRKIANDSLTPTQRRVVESRGNVLVMAGAGTGKTKTLIERCLHCLEHDGAAMDEMLIVTFTEAAAAEMRGRLRRAIEDRLRPEAGNGHEEGQGHPAGISWAEQLARFDLAHIGTLHSFCLKLVREHFYELGLDPRLAVLEEGESRQLANETLDELFATYYAGEDEFSVAVQDLIQTHGGGRDDQIRKLVLRLHHYSQARPDAAGWLAQQREEFTAAASRDWPGWLRAAVEDWRREWRPWLDSLGAGGNEKAVELEAILKRLDAAGSAPDFAIWRETAATVLEQIADADANWPAKRKTVLRQPLEDIFEEAGFLRSLAVVKADADPLVEDWSWVRGQMATLLRLAGEFDGRLAERKQANGALDFHDLEQFALALLWDFPANQPTAVAAAWQAKLKFVFVDEYQDINAAQDQIIAALSRTGAAANRFLVGDVKQSIYRFRLADPQIFRDYARNWQGGAGQTIPLADNFRSRESLLQLVNSVFRPLMRVETGGVAYDADAELRFGAPQARGDFSAARDAGPRAELLVRFKQGRNETREEESAALAGLGDTQREARLVAGRLQRLVADRNEIFDDRTKSFRPVEWRDIAILLRSPRGRTEVFAKEFERAGVPLAVAREGFYQSIEILDLLNLLQLLDNPLQDAPCIAVLRSPLGGLSLAELAQIRLAARDKHFWTALNRSAEAGLADAETAAKVRIFLERCSRWRVLARQVSLSQCLDEILAATLYPDWLRAQPRGAQRAANVTRFLQLARQFDQFQRQGLYRFLKFIEAQQEAEAEPEVPALAVGNAVRLLSIHQSKGLEFPVVVLADLAKPFNELDLRSEIIFDEQFGLCPKVKPPQSGRRYPSLPHWLAQRRQKRELRGEELRLLYVAMTRARDQLILTASITEKSWQEKWMTPQPVAARHIAAAKCFADWLAMWFSNQPPGTNAKESSDESGRRETLHWQIIPDAEFEPQVSGSGEVIQPASGERQAASGRASLESRLKWSYPFVPATRHKAKSSVTALRREAEELSEEAEMLFEPAQTVPTPRRKPATTGVKLSAAEIGAAHHKFMQHVALEQTEHLAEEAERLAQGNYLSAAERAVLDLDALGAFWNSPLGRKIRAHAPAVRREMPFTARFSPRELSLVTGRPADAALENELVIVQGVADLIVLRPEEIWLVDFKTDDVSGRNLPEKVRLYEPQIRLYAAALKKIFARKVTVRALHFLVAGTTVEI